MVNIGSKKKNAEGRKIQVKRLGCLGSDLKVNWDNEGIAELWGTSTGVTGAAILEKGMLARQAR